MARLVEQRNLSLTPEQWLGLERAAEQTNSRATRGTGAHQPAWRTLIRRIADGEVLVQEREPYRMPDGLAEQAAAVEERPREQEIARKAPVKLEQLSMLELEPA